MEPSLAPRAAVLYPIVMELQYTTRGRTPHVGMGLTKRISSRDMVFTVDQPIAEGTKLEIAIAWPVMLHGRIPLKLVIEGEVIERREEEITARIGKYEFRTRRPPSASETLRPPVAARSASVATQEAPLVMCAGR